LAQERAQGAHDTRSARPPLEPLPTAMELAPPVPATYAAQVGFPAPMDAPSDPGLGNVYSKGALEGLPTLLTSGRRNLGAVGAPCQGAAKLKRSRAPAPAMITCLEEPEAEEEGAMLALCVRNTFIDSAQMRSPSLERFYREREVHSCPSSQIGRLRGLFKDSTGMTPPGAASRGCEKAASGSPSEKEGLVRRAGKQESAAAKLGLLAEGRQRRGRTEPALASVQWAGSENTQPAALPAATAGAHSGMSTPPAYAADFSMHTWGLQTGGFDISSYGSPELAAYGWSAPTGPPPAAHPLLMSTLPPAASAGSPPRVLQLVEALSGNPMVATRLPPLLPPAAPPAMPLPPAPAGLPLIPMRGPATALCAAPPALALQLSALPGSLELPSVGSAGHGSGRCKPCAFAHSKGCENGAACRFCHLCEPGEKKRRQKEKQANRKAVLRTREARVIGGRPVAWP